MLPTQGFGFDFMGFCGGRDHRINTLFDLNLPDDAFIDCFIKSGIKRYVSGFRARVFLRTNAYINRVVEIRLGTSAAQFDGLLALMAEINPHNPRKRQHARRQKNPT
ncbi:MAG: hypothetical protein B7X28_09115 [Halothiobacillus sp. 13-55-253]|nr:MAG: hypothetical protein B7X28_09115 [Halothiobacillus sp. 13-55-253]